MSWPTEEAPGPKRKAAKRRFVLKPPVIREHPTQKQICDVLTIEIARPGHVSKHGVVWFSIDMALYGGEVPGARIGRGCVAGLADTWVLYRGAAYMVEVKATDGVLSIPQRELAIAVISAQCRYTVVTDADGTLDALDVWGIPRARKILP